MGPLKATPSYGQFDPSVSTDIFNIPDIANIPDVLNVHDIPIIIYISSSLFLAVPPFLIFPSSFNSDRSCGSEKV